MSRGFSRGKQAIKSANTRIKSRLYLFNLDNKKRRTFYLNKDNNGKLWVDVTVVIFFNAVGTVDVL